MAVDVETRFLTQYAMKWAAVTMMSAHNSLEPVGDSAIITSTLPIPAIANEAP